MSPLIYGLIRLDIEDFLTPQSDWALERMVDQLTARNLSASYGLVGEKVTAMAERGGQSLLRRIGGMASVGYHSASHSRHPTIAEELAEMEYPQAVEAFVRRERPGVEAVSRWVKPPVYFTQPGGNWVPQAIDALPRLDISIFFSESLNSYLIPLSEPMWLGRVLHFSPPVLAPKPFLLGMPDNLTEALNQVHTAPEQIEPNGVFSVMVHPTELVTTKFWDAVNFAHGSTLEPERPAPLRPKVEMDRAVSAFDRYLEEISHVDDIVWTDVKTLADRVRPLTPTRVLRRDFQVAVETMGLGPLKLRTGTLSAAGAAYALAYGVAHPEADAFEVPVLDAPDDWSPGAGARWDTMLPPNRYRELAEQWLEAVHAGAPALPAALRLSPELSLPVERACEGWWSLWRGSVPGGERLPLNFLSFVKQKRDLHWDWPIFPADFHPVRLWQETRRLAWSLTPVSWQPV